MSDIYYEEEARAKMLKGAETLYKAVRTTLGPKGRNVVIGGYGHVTVTHDGVTVAKSVEVKDEAENVGAELIKEASSKLNDVAGDGTTTVTVLTYHLLKEANALIRKKKVSPMQLSKEVEKALYGVANYLDKTKRPADDLETLTKIATLSSGSDEIGKIVAQTVFNVGEIGTIDVVPDASLETTSEMTSGYQLDSGWMSRYMVTDDHTLNAIYENPAIVIIDKEIHSFRELLPILGQIDQSGTKSAVIIANDIKGDALPTMVLNSTKGVFRTLAIKSPSFGKNQREILDDLAIATGATVISSDTVSLDKATLDHIGKAPKVIATSEKTTFMDCSGNIDNRVKQLTEQIKTCKDDFEKTQLEKRRASLSGKVAIIKVGGQTESEIDEKKFRVDDAVAATKAALKDGILPGGGVTLYFAPVQGNTLGAKLLASVLKQPFRQLMLNSNINLKVAEKSIKKGNGEYGINVKTGQYINLIDDGVVDPLMVTKQALATAVSIGIVGMTDGVLIVGDK